MTARPRCQTFPECNSARILRLQNLCVVNAEVNKNSLQRQNDIRMLGREREINVVLLTSHTSAP